MSLWWGFQKTSAKMAFLQNTNKVFTVFTWAQEVEGWFKALGCISNVNIEQHEALGHTDTNILRC